MGEAPRNPPIINPPIRLAVCVSGEGTTLQNLIDQIRSRRLRAEIVQVVASRPRIGAIARAEAASIPLGPGQLQCPVEDRVQHLGLRADPPQQGRPGHPGRLPLAAEHPRRVQGPRDQRPPLADPGVLRQGLLRLEGPRGRAGDRA